MVFLIDCLIMRVHGNDPNNADEKDYKYAVIGLLIGLFFSLCFLAIKFYMIKKQLLDIYLSDSKRPSLRTVELEMKYVGGVSGEMV
ncbi:hypothetical protein SKAU_G00142790 [Synaphobranchus kaupii]|uniref:Uncharacterized protein n=1 Tax=Synaphobranchus kaupii TaxID=118154 RepID=A0A9Q1J4F2_SYNKA|nr:hypothetical protein SKAU_G00142790 [Synaphobranchus kaupii]